VRAIAAPNEQGQVILWEVATGKERRRFPLPPEKKEGNLVIPPWCRYVAFAQGGDVLAGAYTETIHLWNVTTGKELRQLALEERFSYIESLASSPDGKMLAAGCGTAGGVYVWDVATGKLLRRLSVEKGKELPPRVFSVAFSPDGKTLACALGNHKVQFWEVDTGKKIKTLEWPQPKEFSDSPFYLAYSPAGGMIATYGRDESVHLIDIPTGKEVGQLVGQKGYEKSVAFSPDGKRLATTGDSTVLIWDVADALRKARP